jgi:predicted HTH transcriptional regulator
LPPGADRDEPDWADRVLWEGHLFGAYNRIYPLLTRDLPVPFRLVNGVRDNESEQHRALREALVNMLVHADYAERDASLILRWDGGVLIRNPGRSRIPVPGLRGGNRSDPRNPALLRMFRRIGLAEEAGTGFPRIFRTWRELGYELPSIDPGDERYEFALTLSHQHLLSAEDRRWLEDLGVPLTRAEQLALVIARYEGWVDNQAVREVTGLHGADASRVLTGLRDRGYLEMEGTKRGALYRLATALSGPNMMVSEQSIEDSGRSIEDNGQNIEDSGESVEDKELRLTEHREVLLQIAEPARRRKRLPPRQLDEIVIQLCGVEPLSTQQLVALLQRGEAHIREIVRNLVATGAVQPERRSRRHPKQRYLAHSNAMVLGAPLDDATG